MAQSVSHNSYITQSKDADSANITLESRDPREGIGRRADASETERAAKGANTTMTTTPVIQPAPVVPVYVAKIGLRRFTAAVQYAPAPNGWLVSDVSPQRRSALASLEAKLREAGASVPRFRVVDKGDLSAKPAPAAKPEPAPVPAPKPVTPAVPTASSTIAHLNNPSAVAKPVGQIPPRNPEPTAEEVADTLRDLDAVADAAEEAVEQARATMTVNPLPSVAPAMDAGYVTPLSDLPHWLDILNQCRAKLSGLEFPGESRREKIANYRESINLLMESVGFKGAWRRAPSGDFWIRVAGERDETVRQPRARSPFAPTWTKDINGNWVEVTRDKADPRKLATEAKPEVSKERVRELMGEDARPLTRKEQKALNKAAHAAQRQAEKAPKYTGGTTEQRQAAHKHGRFMSGQASAAGHDNHTRTVWYKIGVVASLKAQGIPEPHRYEAELAAEGIGPDVISQHVAMLTGASKVA